MKNTVCVKPELATIESLPISDKVPVLQLYTLMTSEINTSREVFCLFFGEQDDTQCILLHDDS